MPVRIGSREGVRIDKHQIDARCGEHGGDIASHRATPDDKHPASSGLAGGAAAARAEALLHTNDVEAVRTKRNHRTWRSLLERGRPRKTLQLQPEHRSAACGAWYRQ